MTDRPHRPPSLAATCARLPRAALPAPPERKGVKVHVEDMLGPNRAAAGSTSGPARAMPALRAHYDYRSQTAEGSHKTAPTPGRFEFDLTVTDPGTYSILMRASRDTSNPGDARNDISASTATPSHRAAPCS